MILFCYVLFSLLYADPRGVSSPCLSAWTIGAGRRRPGSSDRMACGVSVAWRRRRGGDGAAVAVMGRQWRATVERRWNSGYVAVAWWRWSGGGVAAVEWLRRGGGGAAAAWRRPSIGGRAAAHERTSCGGRSQLPRSGGREERRPRGAPAEQRRPSSAGPAEQRWPSGGALAMDLGEALVFPRSKNKPVIISYLLGICSTIRAVLK